MARRSYSSDEPEVEARDEVVATEAPPAPLTEKQIKQNELDAYYHKVLGDLAREKQEAEYVHDQTEKRVADLEAQKVQIDAEYAERTAAIEAEYPDAPAPPPPATRWGVPLAPKPTPAKPEHALTS